jgi:hypothetical protein
MDLRYTLRSVSFTGAGFDEMDDVSGSRSAELNEDGSLEIELSFHLGDDAVLKARRPVSSSTAC